MTNKLRSKISDFLLRKEIRKNLRKPQVVTFSEAYSIGILYDATTDRDYELIKLYVRDLRASSKDVVALGFFNKKELPNTRFMKLGLDFFTRKSLSWKLKPNDALVNNFINRNFDILICFNLTRSIPLRWITAMTDAKFKIGKYDSGNEAIYDFMIKVENETTLKNMIEQVSHYLKLIRNENQQKA